MKRTLEPRQVLERAMLELKRLRADNERLSGQLSAPVAIIGMSCRFPGGGFGPEGFWALLKKRIGSTPSLRAQRRVARGDAPRRTRESLRVYSESDTAYS